MLTLLAGKRLLILLTLPVGAKVRDSFQKAVGVVEAIGPQVQVTNGDVSVIYQGDVILGRMAIGAHPKPSYCY